MNGVCKDEGCVFKQMKYQIVFFPHHTFTSASVKLVGVWFLVFKLYDIGSESRLMIISNHTERNTTTMIIV